jgi:hypothetical protein
MEGASEKKAVTPREVGEHEVFNGRYAIVRWTLSEKTKVAEVKESLRGTLPEDVGMYGRVSGKRDEVRVVLRFRRKPHYTDVLKHLLLKGGSGQRVFLAKLEQPETWEQFVAKGVEYVASLGTGRCFGSSADLVSGKAEARTRAESEGFVGDVEESEDDGKEGESDEESLYELSANMRKLVLERDVANAKVELAEAKLERKKIDLALFESAEA